MKPRIYFGKSRGMDNYDNILMQVELLNLRAENEVLKGQLPWTMERIAKDKDSPGEKA